METRRNSQNIRGKMEYTNTVYKDITAYIKEHHGYCLEEFLSSDLGKRYLSELDILRQFDGKRIIINFTQDLDIMKRNGEKTGRMKVRDDKIMFFEGKKRTRYQRLDCGLYDGAYATLIPLTIITI